MLQLSKKKIGLVLLEVGVPCVGDCSWEGEGRRRCVARIRTRGSRLVDTGGDEVGEDGLIEGDRTNRLDGE